MSFPYCIVVCIAFATASAVADSPPKASCHSAAGTATALDWDARELVRSITPEKRAVAMLQRTSAVSRGGGTGPHPVQSVSFSHRMPVAGIGPQLLHTSHHHHGLLGPQFLHASHHRHGLHQQPDSVAQKRPGQKSQNAVLFRNVTHVLHKEPSSGIALLQFARDGPPIGSHVAKKKKRSVEEEHQDPYANSDWTEFILLGITLCVPIFCMVACNCEFLLGTHKRDVYAPIAEESHDWLAQGKRVREESPRDPE